MIWGLLELYAAGFDTRYLKEAIALAEATREFFHDETSGGFYMTASDGEELILRSRKVYDGAIPSGNSVMACNLLKLTRLTGNTDHAALAEGVIRAFSAQVSQHPAMSNQLMCALDFLNGPTREIVIVGDEHDARAMLDEINRRFLPNTSVLLKRPDDAALNEIAAFTRDHVQLEGQATAYVCQNFACSLPTNDLATFIASLDQG